MMDTNVNSVLKRVLLAGPSAAWADGERMDAPQGDMERAIEVAGALTPAEREAVRERLEELAEIGAVDGAL